MHRPAAISARLAAGAALALCLASCGDSATPQKQFTGPVCLLSTTRLDFASVTVGQTGEFPVDITNAGIGTLSGLPVLPQLRAVFQVTPDSAFSLGPGESKRYWVRYAPADDVADSVSLSFVGGPCSVRLVGRGVYSRQAGYYGYFPGVPSVIMDFEPGQYAVAYDEQIPTYTLVPVGGLTITQAAVPGEFNSWSRTADTLTQVRPGVWRLALPLSRLAGRSRWAFKFYVNSRYWVQPPADALNRVSTGLNDGSYNLFIDMQ